ncbi:hypothetical protein D623_10001341 [Myotis brandtii]|uniref:Uncharacterized protein n=1 Tax=Myotis brandtii TaxID=109478 RepID=S7PMM1_MYOBR|nr:hypothetical protein D623_10001341 [Myotis brandtii]
MSQPVRGPSFLDTRDAAPVLTPIGWFLRKPIRVTAQHSHTSKSPGLTDSIHPENAGHEAPNPSAAALEGPGPDPDLGR